MHSGFRPISYLLPKIILQTNLSRIFSGDIYSTRKCSSHNDRLRVNGLLHFNIGIPSKVVLKMDEGTGNFIESIKVRALKWLRYTVVEDLHQRPATF